ncbi:tyrosine-protein phosphatase [Novosphingobium fluoreni]|uniref:tyrosine-protein phosphatase n=1 Tax=Novosphingobium fluoreni TaxID=1391222 RepID=UPI001C863659|nr:tyrosine-protein phosphatase [Novosphingobium fluoreni]
MSSHAIPIAPCAPNLRDVGGLAAGEGRTVRCNVLYRSEHLAPPEQEAAALAVLGIRSVIDLRSAREKARAPNAWLRAQGARIYDLDVAADFRAHAMPHQALLDDPGEGGAIVMMTSTYRELPHAAGKALGEAAGLVARGETPLLVHCTAGKDRTGFLCAMLLIAAGVSPDDAMADYLASEGRVHSQVHLSTKAVMADVGIHASDAMLRVLGGVRREFLQTSLSEIDAAFGGIDAYLKHVGVDRAAVRAALVN